MVLKKIVLHFQLSAEAVASLEAAHPTIIQRTYWQRGSTVFLVDITPTQETQIRPILMDTLIEIGPRD